MIARTTRIAAFACLALAWTTRAGGQQRDTIAPNVLPRDVAREVVALFNATGALRATDRVDIEAGRIVNGDVAVLNGPLTIAGHVSGRVLAINADVILRKGARIDGDLLVVGGEVEGSDGAVIGGELRIYHPPLRYTVSGDKLVAAESDQAEDQWWRLWERSGRRNFNRLVIANAGVFNRVEGLPVRIGPSLYRDQGWGHLRLDATAIVRTTSSFSGSHANVGNDVRGEVRIGRQFGATIGGRLFDFIDGVEQWQLNNAEVGLAAFIFHRDYRDYYGRHGGEVHAALRATESADLTLTYGDERWRAEPTNDPFTLVNNDLDWRDNPQMDAARFHVANLTLRIDTRNDTFNPWAGWYLLMDYERGTGRITDPGPTSPLTRPVPFGTTRYQRGFFDLRRYNRLGPDAALNLRVVLGGWMSGDPLPLERRLSIDGPGTVPGYDFRVPSVTDVGTCANGLAPPGRPAQCERVALAQLEYKSNIRISFTDGEAPSRRNRFRADGAWVFFADAGRGWLVNAPGNPLNIGRHDLPPLSSYRTDIGGGLDFDQFGIYAAKALSTPSEALNVFVRIRHRF
jgi:cytoskeletal protein CcmA (bactofilin family)